MVLLLTVKQYLKGKVIFTMHINTSRYQLYVKRKLEGIVKQT